MRSRSWRRESRSSTDTWTERRTLPLVTFLPLGAILSGGRSTRMGTDKASVVLAGTSMLQRVGDALYEVALRVVVLGPDREGWECWPDSVHAQGPLAGIATALSRMTADRAVVVAVDHPLVRPAFLRRLVAIESDLPVVPVDEDGTRQVTCAVYPRTVAAAAVDEANSSGSIQSLLDRVSFRAVAPDEWRQWGEDGRSWLGVDSESDVAKAESLLHAELT